MFAKLNGFASMVEFLDDPEEYDTTPFIDAMDSRIQDVTILSKKLAQVEKELQLTPAYILRSGILSSRAGGAGGASAASASADMDTATFDDRYDEEDADLKMAMQASLMQH